MTDRRCRWLIVALAVAVRVAAVVVLQSHTVPRSSYEHGEIAANLLAGRGFSVQFLGSDGPTSQQAPLYPFVVAGAFALGGGETPRSLLILELGQAVVGGWLAAETMALAGAIAQGRRRVILSAGLIVALYPTLVYAATHVQVALVAATLLTSTLAAGFRTGQTARSRLAVATGLRLGLLILIDPILGLVAPACCWAIALGQGRRLTLRLSAITIAVAGLVVAPWIVRNAAVHGELVLVKSSFGYAFWQGNCALSEGTDKVVRASVERKLARPADSLRSLNTQLWEARHEAGYIDDIALSKDDYATLSKLSEPERSRVLWRRALDDLRREPGRYPALCLRRLRYFFLFDETNPKTRNALYRAGHLGLSALAILGLMTTGPALRRRLGPLILTVGSIGLFHALTIVSARFHIPIEPLLAVCAGCVGTNRGGSTTTADHVEGVGIVSGLVEG